jgi:hypothetical protein
MSTFKQRLGNVIYWLLIAVIAHLVSEVARILTLGWASLPQPFMSSDIKALLGLLGGVIVFAVVAQYLATGEIKLLYRKIVIAVLTTAAVYGVGNGYLGAQNQTQKILNSVITTPEICAALERRVPAGNPFSKFDPTAMSCVAKEFLPKSYIQPKPKSEKPFNAAADCPTLLKNMLKNEFADLVPHYKECSAAGYLPEGYVLDRPANADEKGLADKCDYLRGDSKPWRYYQCIQGKEVTE